MMLPGEFRVNKNAKKRRKGRMRDRRIKNADFKVRNRSFTKS
jgi:hypothetical protein